MRQKARLNAEIIQQQQVGLKKIIQAQEAERQRIATELHDGIGQMITGLRMSMERLAHKVNGYNHQLQDKLNANSKVLDEICLVSTPPLVTSAVRKPSVPLGRTRQSLIWAATRASF